VCKHFDRFHREEDIMETAEEKTVEEEEGWMELAEDEMEDEEMVAFGVEDAVEEEVPQKKAVSYHQKHLKKRKKCYV
jgi:hypothetical protein